MFMWHMNCVKDSRVIATPDCKHVMNRFLKLCLLFTASFVLGTLIAPRFEIETETHVVPDKPVQHYIDRYGESIRRIV